MAPPRRLDSHGNNWRLGIMLVVVLVLLLLAWTDVEVISQFKIEYPSSMSLTAIRTNTSAASTDTSVSSLPSRPPKFAVAHYVESIDQLYGVYSIHRQMIKNNMTSKYIANGTHAEGDVSHVVITPPTIDKNHAEALRQWLGEENIRVVDQEPLRSRLVDSGMWAQTFSKLCIFNLTEFDKIIFMDTDILVRTNLMHWFDYDTPCGTQQKGDIAWNSGAMVIKPSSHIFDQMMQQLPSVKRYDPQHVYGEGDDPLNAGYSDQDYITAFFINHTLDTSKKRCVFPAEASILSSVFGDGRWNYYQKFRPFIYQTVHFTVHKPWRTFTAPNTSFLCSMLAEWYESVEGIEQYYHLIPPLTKYSEHCS